MTNTLENMFEQFIKEKTHQEVLNFALLKIVENNGGTFTIDFNNHSNSTGLGVIIDKENNKVTLKAVTKEQATAFKESQMQEHH